MTAFAVSFRLRADSKDMTASEAEQIEPYDVRVIASDAQRAISTLVNTLKANGDITSKADVKILEVRVVP